MHTKTILPYSILFIIGIHLQLFSQKQVTSTPSAFETIFKTKSNAFVQEPTFYKAQTFFLEREWDSTLVYSLKLLEVAEKDSALFNYGHFLRGYSFIEKKNIYRSRKRVE